MIKQGFTISAVWLWVGVSYVLVGVVVVGAMAVGAVVGSAVALANAPAFVVRSLRAQ